MKTSTPADDALYRTPSAQADGDTAAEAPLYIQLARTLKDEIVSGIYPIGGRLPKEELLGARFSVSRFTVRQALRLLREEGLVQSRQGAGTVVAPLAEPGSYVHHVMSINDLDAFAHMTRLEIGDISTVTMEDGLAERVRIPVGQEWLRATGLRYAEGVEPPVSQIEYYIHRDFSQVGRLLKRHTGPVFPLIEDMFAVQIVEVHQDIGATSVVSPLAETLGLESGAAALEIVRAYRIADGRIAQVTVNTHPAARFRHTMAMRRVKT